jgi:hypothetical protein
MDPQIALSYGSPSFLAEKYGAQLDRLVAAGDAIGLHPHAWRWQADQRVWVADHGNQAWLDECVELAVRSFRESFDMAPTYHRFGAQFMSTPTMNLLARLGVGIDLTVEPGEPPNRGFSLPGAIWTGETGDFRCVPRLPYKPAPDDYTRCAQGTDNGLWELPLTSARQVISRRLLPIVRSRLGHPVRSARGLWRKLAGARQRRDWLSAPHVKRGANSLDEYRLLAMWAGQPRPAQFWDLAFSAAMELEQPYLAFAIRTEMGSDPVLLSRFNAILDALASDPRATTVSFVSPEEALATLRPQGY